MQRVDIVENHHPQEGVMLMVIVHHTQRNPDFMLCIGEKFIKPFNQIVGMAEW